MLTVQSMLSSHNPTHQSEIVIDRESDTMALLSGLFPLTCAVDFSMAVEPSLAFTSSQSYPVINWIVENLPNNHGAVA